MYKLLLDNITSADSAVVAKKKGIGPTQAQVIPLFVNRLQIVWSAKTSLKNSKQLSHY